MISLRIQSPYEREWTEVSFDGEEEEESCHVLCATLLRLEWNIAISRDGSPYFELGEEEEPT